MWRSMSRIEVHVPAYSFHGHDTVESVSFNLPSEVGELLERRVLSWWQRAGEDWPPDVWSPDGLHDIHDLIDLATELTVWLQVWYPTERKPIVLQRSLQLSSHLRENFYIGSRMGF